MEKLRIGVLGCANIAQRSVIPAILSIPEFELVAVASRTEKRAKEFSELFNCEAIVGYQNLLDRSDIDLIYMPLPTGLHEEWVIKTLEKRKHILVEKSLALNYSSAKKMVDIARTNKLLIMENFMFLYHGQHRFVKKLILEDQIGDIRAFRSSFGFPPLSLDNFRYNKELGGGALLDAGAYTIRASQLILGDNLIVAGSTLNNIGMDVDIYGGAFLKNDSGVFSEIAFGFDNFYQCNYEIWGSKGKIVVEKAFTPAANYNPIVKLYTQNEVFEHELDAENHFINILTEFKRSIKEDDFEPKYNEVLNQARLLQEVMDKSKLS